MSRYVGISFKEYDFLNAPLDGRTIIEASAGTGKTHTITLIFLRLILERHIPVNKILVVTFTEAAAQELKERIYKTLHTALQYATGKNLPDKKDITLEKLVAKADPALAVDALNGALRSFDTAAVNTIHGFCRRVLLEHAFESGSSFDADLEPDESVIVEQASHDFWRRTIYSASPLFIGYLANRGCADPGYFQELYRMLKTVLEYRILPEAIADCAAENDEKQLLKHFDDLKKLWRKHRGEIVSLLKSPSLNKAVYSDAIIGKMAILMDSLIEREYPDPDSGKKSIFGTALKKFSSGWLGKGTKKNTTVPRHRFFDAYDRFDESLQRLFAAYEQKMLFLKEQFLSQIGRYLNRVKSAKNIVSFDDLLTGVRTALGRNNYLRNAIVRQYHAALVDEFQDTDSIQYGIFDRVFGKESPLFLVGDPKQAIYRFRGADIFSYFKAVQNADHRFTLSKNYRANELLLRAINTLFGEHDLPFAFEDIPYRNIDAGSDPDETALCIDGEQQVPFTLWTIPRDVPDSCSLLFKSQTKEPAMKAVASEINTLLSFSAENRAHIGRQPVRASDIAVLVHTNNEAKELHAFFKSYSIPSIIHISDSVFASDEAFDLQVVLSAIAAPSRHKLVKAALTTPVFGLSALDIDNLSSDENLWEQRLIRISFCHDQWRQQGILTMFLTLMHTEHLGKRMAAQSNGERVLTNFLHIAELLHREELRSGANMSAIIKWLSNKRSDTRGNKVPPDEEMIRLDTDAEAVRIITIHKSKGLEYPIVFAPFNWHPSYAEADPEKPIVFHDTRYGFAPTIALGTDAISDHQDAVNDETLAENLRLLYVALTRAKTACYCIWSPTRGAESSALAWLLFSSGADKPYAASLSAKIETLNDRDALKKIHDLCSKSGGTLQAIQLPDTEPQILPAPENKTAGTVCLTFTSSIPAPRMVRSYTSLSRRWGAEAHYESPDFDAVFSPDTVEAEDPSGDTSIFALPHGAKSGILLHDLLEKIDFGKALSPETASLVQSKLGQHGFEAALTETIIDLMSNVTTRILDPATGLKLENIPGRQCIKELEFYFPVRAFSRKELFDIVGENDLPETDDSTLSQGHIKGFVDLVFSFGERFYIVDWKSNFLGAQPDNYSPEALVKVLHDQHYLLQYHLYCVALHQYLTLRKPGYSYDKHFGGVYYIFLRGLNDDINSQNGIFFDRPEKKKITKLCELLIK
jgi:exodeoxyribonuclease V beta subunit